MESLNQNSIKKLFFSVALFSAMSASCFANGNNGTTNPSNTNANDKTAKVETIEVKEEASSPEALHCKVYGADGKLIYECWVCDCSRALNPK